MKHCTGGWKYITRSRLTDIKLAPKIFCSHRRALNVPTRSPWAPWAIPTWFARLGRFPKRKVLQYPKSAFPSENSLRFIEQIPRLLNHALQILLCSRMAAMRSLPLKTSFQRLLCLRNLRPRSGERYHSYWKALGAHKCFPHSQMLLCRSISNRRLRKRMNYFESAEQNLASSF